MPAAGEAEFCVRIPELVSSVLVPVKDRSTVRLRVVAKPDKHVQVLLDRMGIKLPNQAKIIENVVEKMRP